MGFKLTEIKERDKIILYVSKDGNSMRFVAILKQHVKNECAIISVEYEEGTRLVFDNVRVDIEYAQENDVPIVWKAVKIAAFKNDYVIKATSDGLKSNRRDSYRVPVAKTGSMYIPGSGAKMVTIKDVSASGFGIADRPKELKLAIGDSVNITFDDLGHTISLGGRLKRIEEREDMNILGFEINTLCKDLPVYIAEKQRSGRRRR